jgi:hypothetical protein
MIDPLYDGCHEILPLPGEKHASLTIKYEHVMQVYDARPPTRIREVHCINGVWQSGWDFPTIYPGRGE